MSDKTKDGEHAASSSVGAADSQKGGRRVAMPNGWGMGLSDTKVRAKPPSGNMREASPGSPGL